VLIVSNNPMVEAAFGDSCVFIDGRALDVLIYVRDMLHKGHKLLSHPLAGSVKPYESPIRSVCVSKDKGAYDMQSILLMENAIDRYKTLSQRNFIENHNEDFQLIDLSLIQSAVESRFQDRDYLTTQSGGAMYET
jgi:hypothetical protein